MNEECADCKKDCRSIKTIQFTVNIASTPFHIRNNSVDYLNVCLFQCECGRIWFSFYYNPTYKMLDEVKVGELKKS